jgi:O-antigen/teichoic acid export membrane protein
VVIEFVPRVKRPSSFGRLGRNTLVNGVGGVLGRGVSVIMLPVYTRCLSPAENGVLQLLDISVDVTAILFTAGIRSGLQRFYFKASTDEERKKVVFTTFFLEMVLTVVGSLSLVFLWELMHSVALDDVGGSILVRLAALNFALSAMMAVPVAYLMIEQRAAIGTIAGLVKLAIQVALNVYFLVYRHLGVESILLSTTIATAIVGSVLVVWMIGRTGIRVSRQVVRDLRRFGVPYQIATAASFILTFGDRFFLEHFRGAADVGLYGLAYQFGFLLYSVSSGPFLTAWGPIRYEWVSRPREERDAAYARGFLYFNFVLVTAAMGIVVFVRPVLTLLTSNPFHSASGIVPIVVASYVVQSWGDVARFGIDVAERTKLYTRASWIATAVVIVAYALLIPRFGGFGAAWATFIAFVVRSALTLHWSQQVWPVTYQWSRSFLLTAIAVGVSAPAFLLPATSVFNEAVLGIGLTVLYAALVWRFVLDVEHRAGIVTIVSTRKMSAVFRRS